MLAWAADCLCGMPGTGAERVPRQSYVRSSVWNTETTYSTSVIKCSSHGQIEDLLFIHKFSQYYQVCYIRGTLHISRVVPASKVKMW